MDKLAQSPAGLTPLAPPVGSDPSMAAGGLGGMPPIPGISPEQQPGQAGSAVEAKPKIYKGLSSPEDILQDYDIKNAFEQGESSKEIANDIWASYGGDPKGPRIIFEGQWPANEDASQQQNTSNIETKFKSTENAKWQRLEQGKTILDVFPGGTQEIEKYVSWYASGMGLTKKPAATAVDTASWYKLANNYNG